MAIWHIVPVNDLKEHEDCSMCHCHPKVNIEDGNIFIIHNSYDRRELAEDFIANIKNGFELEMKN